MAVDFSSFSFCSKPFFLCFSLPNECFCSQVFLNFQPKKVFCSHKIFLIKKNVYLYQKFKIFSWNKDQTLINIVILCSNCNNKIFSRRNVFQVWHVLSRNFAKPEIKNCGENLISIVIIKFSYCQRNIFER